MASPFPITELADIQLGAPLDPAQIAALGLKRVDDADGPDDGAEEWQVGEDGLSVVVDDGVVFLINATEHAVVAGANIIGLPCEDVAKVLDPPDRFHNINGEWIYEKDDDLLEIGFWGGHVAWVMVTRAGDT